MRPKARGNIYCVKCRKNRNCELVTGKEIYPHRPDLYELCFYKCPKCGNYVGCHKGTNRPLGVIPTPELRQARMKVHAKLDPLWKNGIIERNKLYKMLSDELGYKYHTAETRSIEQCLQVYDLICKIEKDI